MKKENIQRLKPLTQAAVMDVVNRKHDEEFPIFFCYTHLIQISKAMVI